MEPKTVIKDMHDLQGASPADTVISKPEIPDRSRVLRRVSLTVPAGRQLPATSLMRTIMSSTAFSTGTLLVTMAFTVFIQTFSLLSVVNL